MTLRDIFIWVSGVPRREPDNEVRQVEGTIVAIFPEFHQGRVLTPDGTQYAITDRTPGIDLEALREGQQLRCKVTGLLPRVVSASVIG